MESCNQSGWFDMKDMNDRAEIGLQTPVSLAFLQDQLCIALVNKHIPCFHIALKRGARPTAPDDQQMSVYEKALMTPGCADFVTECLRYGADANFINRHLDKAAINFAVDSGDPKVVKALLLERAEHVDREYDHLTPLNALAKSITQTNFNNVFECMRLLLNYGACGNKHDDKQMTPLHHILDNGKIDEELRAFLVYDFVAFMGDQLDIDTCQDGAVRTLLNNKYPNIALPPEAGVAKDDVSNAGALLQLLQRGNEEHFLQQYDLFLHSARCSEQKHMKLLVEAIKRGQHAACKAMVKHVAGNDLTPLNYAILCGNGQALQLLLDSRRFDINEYDAQRGYTPLQYAIKHRNADAIKALLSHGAYIDMRSAVDDLRFGGLQPDVLEEHLDRCVTTNDSKPDDAQFMIVLDLQNLMPPTSVREAHVYDELAPIKCMLERKAYRHLLQHPLINSFLFLKWHRLWPLFYMNFLIYSVFTISITGYTVLKFNADNKDRPVGFWLAAWIGIVYMVLGEVLQLVLCGWKYFQSVTNVFKLVLIVLSALTCSNFGGELDTERGIGVFTILAVALKISMVIGSVPMVNISTHMLMLRAVSISFLKSFAFHLILVFSFSMCFYIALREQRKPNNQGFNNPFTVVFHTLVMMTGEFNAYSINFKSPYAYVIFLIFVFFMSIVLFNLLTGIAVSDTQLIRAQAELNSCICRAELLIRYSDILSNCYHRPTFFWKWWRHLGNLLPQHVNYTIAILPNDYNRVIITYRQPEKDMLSTCCQKSYYRQRMYKGAVQLAMAILKKRAMALHAKERETYKEMRLRRIEHKLDKVLRRLQRLAPPPHLTLVPRNLSLLRWRGRLAAAFNSVLSASQRRNIKHIR